MMWSARGCCSVLGLLSALILAGCGEADAGYTPLPSNAGDAEVGPADTGKPATQPDVGNHSSSVPKGPICQSDDECPSFLPVCFEGHCAACLTEAECGAGQFCVEHQCLVCKPGLAQCAGGVAVVKCKDDSSGFDVVEQCAEDGVCNAGQCFNCYPSTKRCEAGTAYECAPTGAEWIPIQDCELAGMQCHLGVCLSPCGSDFKANTNAGCGFYAIDLDNAVDVKGMKTWDAWSAQFAVSASNTTELPAVVTVTLPDGSKETREVGPLSLETFTLPQSWGQDDTRRSMSAYRIEADQPITVYQFNPLSNEGVFSNDASVLLPAAGLSGEYFAISHRQIDNKFRGFVTMVGVGEATTSVEITPTTTTLAGGDIPAITAWATHTFTLEQGEVVNIESDVPGGDLTGTHVVADGPIAVFSGHEAAITSDQCCADHLEQQLVPVAAWGQDYVMTRSMPRGKEKDYYRVVAARPGTTVSFAPAVTTPSVQVLEAGGFIELATDSDFRVTSDKPIMVAQLLASSFEVLSGPGNSGSCFAPTDCPDGYTCTSNKCNPPACGLDAVCPDGHTCTDGECQPIGDPALILGVPVEQWRMSYVFLTPNSYAEDYINVVASTGTVVTLDGNVINGGAFSAIGGSSFVVYRAKVTDGVHQIVADKPVAVTVYGYDKDVSYGYPGGLGLQALTQ